LKGTTFKHPAVYSVKTYWSPPT